MSRSRDIERILRLVYMTDRELDPDQHASRPFGRLAVAAVAVVVVVSLMLAAGWRVDSPPSTGSPRTSFAAPPAFTDLPLVAVAPTASSRASGTPAGSGATLPAPSATPAGERGIIANRIRVARLDIDLAIIEGDGLDAPIGKAAHYPGSAWPGAGSNVYIYGHAREGMFINLWQTEMGDRIELDLLDGSSRAYVVTKVLPKVPWDAMAYLEPTPTEQLTVQTSTSYFSTAPRFIVIASPAP